MNSVDLYSLITLLRYNGLFDHRLLRHIPVPDCDYSTVNERAIEYSELLKSINDSASQSELIMSLLVSLYAEQRVIDSIMETMRIHSLRHPPNIKLGITYDCTVSLLRESADGATPYEPFMNCSVTFIGNGALYIDSSIGYILQCDPILATPLDVVCDTANRTVEASFAIDINGVHATHLCIVYRNE